MKVTGRNRPFETVAAFSDQNNRRFVYIDIYQLTTLIDQKTQMETIWSIVDKMKDYVIYTLTDDETKVSAPCFILDFRFVEYGITLMDPSMTFFRRFFYELFVYIHKNFYPADMFNVRVTGINIPNMTMEEIFGDLDLRMLERSAEVEVERLFENAIPKE